jgi:Mce-associated membrane protein
MRARSRGSHTLSEQPTDVTDDLPSAEEDEPSGDDQPGTDAGTTSVDADDSSDDQEKSTPRGRRRPHRRFDRTTLLARVIFPGLALLLTTAAVFLKWQDSTIRQSEIASTQAVQAAREGTVAMLSYKPDTVDKDLSTARDYLTGGFRESYTKLTEDVVIPGAKQQRVSAVATVPAAATVSAGQNRAVVLVFVNQTTVVGNGAPTDTVSCVRVALDKVEDRWLISDFQPI